METAMRLRGEHPPIPHPNTGKPTQFLLLWPGGSRPTRHDMYHELRSATKRARLIEPVSSHRLRHTYATEMLRAGTNPFDLMRILGHRTLEMILRYAKVIQSEIQNPKLSGGGPVQ